MIYQEALDWLYRSQMFGIKLGLDGTRHLLKEYLAYPAHDVKVIHVAGTNGKGSTCAMIDSIARACGQRCGLFTSPHLIDFRERMKVSGQEISEETCAAMLTELREICERMETHPTFFEITLVLAMRWFRDRDCEMIVLETGMGGRLDATTAVPADVCVLTPIGMDHMQWLGDTLEKIALEKAGIFVTGKPAVSALQDNKVCDLLKKEANEKRVPLSFVEEPLLGYPMALLGEHQQWNAALAVAALGLAGLHLNSDSVHYGLSKVSWPGRFERICPDVILDGAHNPQSAEVLAATWEKVFPGEKAVLVFSAVDGKDIDGILRFLAPLAAKILLCPVDTPRAVSAQELANHLPENSPPHEVFQNFEKAFAAAKLGKETILIAGSLFLVGEARGFLTNQKFQRSSQ
ncbi:MAG: bifunctional folylpolyglutamate synthase/dihydrofolate synthase [Akkermansiaceae bacterium]|nr:bifunctional folylpolyglutamate synthase/dihydrofolate synthase [Akkermansiaceae bacterium]